ncbi:MAG: polysaccharide export protein [Pyrinomonadaceae bacterium]|nr:polysaccharide export protein [Pyrinomonadaceae bacterium]
MKAVKLSKSIGLLAASVLIFSLGAAAQETAPPQRDRVIEKEIKKDSTEVVKIEDSSKSIQPTTTEIIAQTPVEAIKIETPTPTPEVKIDDKNLSGEEAAVLAYYSNYLTEYRLGPNDIISVEVFGQCPDYCKENITVPPTAKVSYPLIRGGVLVGGRTVEQVQDEITKKLDEYIIEPKVTVTLVKAMSARYSVMGKVAAPGIRVMDRKVSLYEAVIESGGVLKTGDKKKIALIRFSEKGTLSRQNVNLAEIESGKIPMIYLNPGDQVFVPGKGFTVDTVFQILNKASLVRLLFGSPF